MHILLVEDEEFERLSFVKLLQKEGYEVAAAENGQQAVDLLTAAFYPVVIMDLFLSDLLAFDIIPSIKSFHPSVKIILLTAEVREEYQQKAQQMGVDAYVLKPIDPDELFSLLSRFSTEEH